MPRTLRSARHESMRAILVTGRKKAGLTQAELAKRIGRYQSFIADVERGQRRVDVVEFLEMVEALQIDPARAIRKIARSG